VMAEYGAGTMQELQIFYAPRFDYSVGGGHVDLTSDVDGRTEHINYARLNWLAHRWNLDDEQANVFVWGGAGSATGNSFNGTAVTGNAGAQVDYETRRSYALMPTVLKCIVYSANGVKSLVWHYNDAKRRCNADTEEESPGAQMARKLPSSFLRPRRAPPGIRPRSSPCDSCSACVRWPLASPARRCGRRPRRPRGLNR
jgi:hypothetical protein